MSYADIFKKTKEFFEDISLSKTNRRRIFFYGTIISCAFAVYCIRNWDNVKKHYSNGKDLVKNIKQIDTIKKQGNKILLDQEDLKRYIGSVSRKQDSLASMQQKLNENNIEAHKRIYQDWQWYIKNRQMTDEQLIEIYKRFSEQSCISYRNFHISDTIIN